MWSTTSFYVAREAQILSLSLLSFLWNSGGLNLFIKASDGLCHVIARAGLPNLFGAASHFHMRKFIAGHKRFVT